MGLALRVGSFRGLCRLLAAKGQQRVQAGHALIVGALGGLCGSSSLALRSSDGFKLGHRLSKVGLGVEPCGLQRFLFRRQVTGCTARFFHTLGSRLDALLQTFHCLGGAGQCLFSLVQLTAVFRFGFVGFCEGLARLLNRHSHIVAHPLCRCGVGNEFGEGHPLLAHTLVVELDGVGGVLVRCHRLQVGNLVSVEFILCRLRRSG